MGSERESSLGKSCFWGTGKSRLRGLRVVLALVILMTIWPGLAAAATWTVDSTANYSSGSANSGTLRYVLERVANGDTILFDESLDGETITLTSRITTDKTNLSFVVPEGKTVTIDAVSVTGTGNYFGNSIGPSDKDNTTQKWNFSGNLIWTDATIVANKNYSGLNVHYPVWGGTVFAPNIGTLEGSFVNNSGTINQSGSDQAEAAGIGVYVRGEVGEVSATFSGNSAAAYGGTGTVYARGAAIRASSIDVFSGSATNNSALAQSVSGSAYIYGGGVYGSITSLTGSVSDNTAQAMSTSGSAYVYGGGVYGSIYSIDPVSGVISGNIAEATSGGNTTISQGGGIMGALGAAFTGTLRNNQAIAVNTGVGYAQAFGGGAYTNYNYFYEGTTLNGEVSGNQAQAQASDADQAASALGGGLYVSSGNVHITGGNYTDNRAVAIGSNAYAKGGGIFINDSSYFVPTLISAIYDYTNATRNTILTLDPVNGNILFQGNSVTVKTDVDDPGTTMANGIHFGNGFKEIGNSNFADMGMRVTGTSAHYTAIYDGISTDLNNGKSFTLVKDGTSGFDWGGTNVLDAEGGSTVTLGSGTRFVSGFSLDNGGRNARENVILNLDDARFNQTENPYDASAKDLLFSHTTLNLLNGAVLAPAGELILGEESLLNMISGTLELVSGAALRAAGNSEVSGGAFDLGADQTLYVDAGKTLTFSNTVLRLLNGSTRQVDGTLALADGAVLRLDAGIDPGLSVGGALRAVGKALVADSILNIGAGRILRLDADQSLTLNANSTLHFDDGILAVGIAQGAEAGKIISLNNSTAPVFSGSNTLDLETWLTGQHIVLQSEKALSANAPASFVNFSAGGNAINPATMGMNLSLVNGGKDLQLAVSLLEDSGQLVWGGSSGTWNYTHTNWKEGATPDKSFTLGDLALFDGTNADGTSLEVTVGGTAVETAGMSITSGSYTFTGGKLVGRADISGGNDIAPTARLDIAGSGKIIFNNRLEFENGLNVAGGSSADITLVDYSGGSVLLGSQTDSYTGIFSGKVNIQGETTGGLTAQNTETNPLNILEGSLIHANSKDGTNEALVTGGGIHTSGGLDSLAGKISENSVSSSGAGSVAMGGGVFSGGSIADISADISKNQATSSATGANLAEAYGGGIFIADFSDAGTLITGSFTDNRAEASGNTALAHGGALYLSTLGSNTAKLTLNPIHGDILFQGNTVVENGTEKANAIHFGRENGTSLQNAELNITDTLHQKKSVTIADGITTDLNNGKSFTMSNTYAEFYWGGRNVFDSAGGNTITLGDSGGYSTTFLMDGFSLERGTSNGDTSLITMVARSLSVQGTAGLSSTELTMNGYLGLGLDATLTLDETSTFNMSGILLVDVAHGNASGKLVSLNPNTAPVFDGGAISLSSWIPGVYTIVVSKTPMAANTAATFSYFYVGGNYASYPGSGMDLTTQLSEDGKTLQILAGLAQDSALKIWGGADGSWQYGTVNWKIRSGDPAAFVPGDLALFDGTNADNTALTVTVGGTQMDTAGMSIMDGSYIFTGGKISARTDISEGSDITPTGRLDIAGSGTIVFEDAVDFVNGLTAAVGSSANITFADYTGGRVVLGTSSTNTYQGDFSGKLNIQNQAVSSAATLYGSAATFWSQAGKTVRLLDGSVIADNSIYVTGSYGTAYGGGIYSTADLYLGGNVTGNSATHANAPSGSLAAWGGGVFSTGKIFITGNVSGNSTYAEGNGFSGAQATGAGLYVTSASGIGSLSGTVSGNTATAISNGDGTSHASGGGFYAISLNSFTGTLSNNSAYALSALTRDRADEGAAAFGGGASLNTTSTLSGNVMGNSVTAEVTGLGPALAKGGGISFSRGTLTVNKGDYLNNTATAIGSKAVAQGGAILLSTQLSTASRLVLDPTAGAITFTGNTVTTKADAAAAGTTTPNAIAFGRFWYDSSSNASMEIKDSAATGNLITIADGITTDINNGKSFSMSQTGGNFLWGGPNVFDSAGGSMVFLTGGLTRLMDGFSMDRGTVNGDTRNVWMRITDSGHLKSEGAAVNLKNSELSVADGGKITVDLGSTLILDVASTLTMDNGTLSIGVGEGSTSGVIRSLNTTIAPVFTGSNTLDISEWIPGTYVVLGSDARMDAGTAATFTTFTVGGNAIDPDAYTLAVALNDERYDLLVTAALNQNSLEKVWGGTSGTWNYTDQKWGADNSQKFVLGDLAKFDGTNAGAGLTIAVGGTSVETAGMSITSGSYTFSGGKIVGRTDISSGNTIAPTGRLDIAGSGNIIFNNAVDFVNGFTVGGASANITLADYTGGRVMLGTSMGNRYSGTFSGKLRVENQTQSGDYLQGGGVQAFNSNAVSILDGSIISGNSLNAFTDSDWADAVGGGVYALTTAGTSRVSTLAGTVSGNSATAESISGVATANGGGVFAKTISSLSATVSGNTAFATSGADEAFASGGGVHVSNTVSTLSGSITGNTAQAAVTGGDAPALALGGGVYFEEPGAVTITQGTYTGNRAIADGINARAEGGALFLGTAWGESSLTLDAIDGNILFSGNTTVLNGVETPNAIHFGRYSLGQFSYSASLLIQDSTASGKRITIADGISVDINDGESFTMTQDFGSFFEWGGTNVFDAEGGSHITLSGATVFLSGFSMDNGGVNSGDNVVLNLNARGAYVMASNPDDFFADTIAFRHTTLNLTNGAYLMGLGRVLELGESTVVNVASGRGIEFNETTLHITGDSAIDGGNLVIGEDSGLTVDAGKTLTLGSGTTLSFEDAGLSVGVASGNVSGLIDISANTTTAPTFSGSNRLNISEWIPGTYTVLVAGKEMAEGVPATFQTLTVGGNSLGAGMTLTPTLSSDGKSVILLAGLRQNSSEKTWGGSTGTWNYVNTNWKEGAATGKSFVLGDLALFDGTGAASGLNITVGGTSIETAGMSVTGGNYLFTGGGIIARTDISTGTIITPTGKLILSGGSVDFTGITGANRFENGVEIGAARLRIADESQLGTTLSKFVFMESTQGTVSSAVTALKTAVTNNTGVETAQTNLETAITTAQGTTLGVLAFTDDAIFTASTDTADQRLDIGSKAVSVDVAVGKAVTIAGNSYIANAEAGGALFVGTGGLFAKTGDGAIVFDGNAAGRPDPSYVYAHGGAVYNKGTVSLNDSVVFSNNTSTGYGGAINNDQGVLTLSGNVDFIGNTSGSGGAIRNLNGTVILAGETTFKNNTAEYFGGAIDNQGANSILILSGKTFFIGNGGGAHGAAVYNRGIVDISGETIFENNSTTGNSTLENTYGTLNISGPVTFTNNTGYAGAMDITGGSTSRTNLTGSVQFIDNNARGEGGAIYIIWAPVNLIPIADETILFSGNQANGVANSIHISQDGTLVVGGVGTVDMRDPMTGEASSRHNTLPITITKSGTGAWKLGGSNSFVVETSYPNARTQLTVSDGTLHLYRAGEVDNGRNGLVETGTISLAGTGSFFTLGSNATLSLGGDGHAITASAITMASGSTLALDLGQIANDGSVAALGLSASTYTLANSGTLNLDLDVTGFTEGSFVILRTDTDEFGAITDFGSPTLQGGLNDRVSLGLASANSGKDLVLTISASNNFVLTWTGAADEAWDMTTANWSDSSDGKFISGDAVVFDATGSGRPNVTIPEVGVTVAGMDVRAGDYLFSGGGIVAKTTNTSLAGTDAHGKLRVASGSADFTAITGTNSFEKGVEIGTGRLTLADESQLGTTLSKLAFTENMPTAVTNAVTALSTAITNNTGIESAQNNLETAIATAQGTTLGVLAFTDDVPFTASGGTTDQRLNVGSKAANIDVADGKTVTISGNSTDSLSGGAVNLSSGGLFVKTGDGTLAFSANSALDGGALYNHGGTVNLSGPASFTNNNASSGGGGAIYSYNGSVFLDGPVTFATNTTASSGGAIHNSTKTVALTGLATFTDNEATEGGGAIYNINGTVIMSGGANFNNNSSTTKAGGAIYNTGGTVTLSGATTFENNASINQGGAIYTVYGSMNLNGSTAFTNNTTTGFGGALYAAIGTVNLSTSGATDTILFTGNQANNISNSVYLFGNTTMNISGVGSVDMRDAMGGSAYTNTLTIAKSGTGTWKLGGGNVFTADEGGRTTLTVSDGTLHLYRAGEVDNGRNGAVETGTISLAGTGSFFTLGSNATLSLGGTGHAITASAITMASGSTFALDLALHSDTASDPMLALTGTVMAEELNINLLSVKDVGVAYTLVQETSGSADFSSAVGLSRLTYKGSALSGTRLDGMFTLEGTASGMILLTQTGAVLNKTLAWTGATDSNWDYSTENWNDGTDDTSFFDGDKVVFGGRADSNPVIIDNGGLVVAGMEITAGSYAFEGGDIRSAGPDETTLSGGDYTGALLVSGGSALFSNSLDFENGYSVASGAAMGFSGLSLAGDIENEGTFRFDVATGNSLMYADTLSGAGGFRKTGSGVLYLTAADHSGATGSFGVDGGTLGGAFTYGGSLDVQNGAVLAPGAENAIGTMTVASANFEAGATLGIRATEAGADKLVSTGDVTISNTGTRLFLTNGTPGLVWSPGLNPAVIESVNGTITGTFADVDASALPFLSVSPIYNEKTVILDLGYKVPESPDSRTGFTRNQLSVVRAIDTMTGGPVQTAMMNVGSIQEGATLASFLSNEINASIKVEVAENDRSFGKRQRARLSGKNSPAFNVSGVSAGALDENTDFWFSVDGYKNTVDRTSNTSKTELKGWGASLGVEKDVYAWTLGGAFRYGDSEYKVRDLASKADLDSFNFGLYAGRPVGDFNIKLGAGYGFHQVDSRRHVPSMAETLKADYDIHSFQVFGELGYLKDFGCFALEPYAGLSWNMVQNESYTEKSGNSALKAKSDSDANFTSSLGVRGHYRPAEKVKLGLDLNWQHLYGDKNPEARFAFTGSDFFTIEGAPMDRDSVGLGLDVDVEIGKNWNIRAGYLGRHGEDSDSHAGFVTLEFAF